jgi:hypothetical protein
MKLSLIFTQFLEDKERKIRGAYHETMEEDDDDDDDDDDEDEDKFVVHIMKPWKRMMTTTMMMTRTRTGKKMKKYV